MADDDDFDDFQSAEPDKDGVNNVEVVENSSVNDSASLGQETDLAVEGEHHGDEPSESEKQSLDQEHGALDITGHHEEGDMSTPQQADALPSTEGCHGVTVEQYEQSADEPAASPEIPSESDGLGVAAGDEPAAAVTAVGYPPEPDRVEMVTVAIADEAADEDHVAASDRDELETTDDAAQEASADDNTQGSGDEEPAVFAPPVVDLDAEPPSTADQEEDVAAEMSTQAQDEQIEVEAHYAAPDNEMTSASEKPPDEVQDESVDELGERDHLEDATAAPDVQAERVELATTAPSADGEDEEELHVLDSKPLTTSADVDGDATVEDDDIAMVHEVAELAEQPPGTSQEDEEFGEFDDSSYQVKGSEGEDSDGGDVTTHEPEGDENHMIDRDSSGFGAFEDAEPVHSPEVDSAAATLLSEELAEEKVEGHDEFGDFEEPGQEEEVAEGKTTLDVAHEIHADEAVGAGNDVGDVDDEDFGDFGDFEGPSASTQGLPDEIEPSRQVDGPTTVIAQKAQIDEDDDFGDFESTAFPAEPVAVPNVEPKSVAPAHEGVAVAVPQQLEHLLDAEKKRSYAEFRTRVDSIFGPAPAIEAKLFRDDLSEIQSLFQKLLLEDQSPRPLLGRKPEHDAIIQAWVATQIPQDVHAHAAIMKELDEPMMPRSRTRSTPPQPQPVAQPSAISSDANSHSSTQSTEAVAVADQERVDQSTTSTSHPAAASMVDLDFLESFSSTSSHHARASPPAIHRGNTEGDLEIFAAAAPGASGGAFTFSSSAQSPVSEYTPDVLRDTSSPQITRKPSMSDAARAFLDSLPDLSFLLPPKNPAAPSRT